MASEPRYLPRRAQFALELIDPFTGERVHAGITASAVDVGGKPIARLPVVNASGQFVWLHPLKMPPEPPAEPPTELPWAVLIDPGKTPFLPATVVLPNALPASLLVTYPLQPSRAYPAPAGITAVSGVLFEQVDGKRTPVTDAIIRLSWDDAVPAAFAGIKLGDGASDKDGEFVAATHAKVPVRVALGEGERQARLLIARTTMAQQRWTRCDVTAGRLRPLTKPLDWTQLQPSN